MCGLHCDIWRALQPSLLFGADTCHIAHTGEQLASWPMPIVLVSPAVLAPMWNAEDSPLSIHVYISRKTLHMERNDIP